MGVHTGEASLDDDAAVVGLDVHKAARIMAAGHGGQVLLSAATSALVSGSLPGGAALRSLGEHRLKDLAAPEEIFQLCAPGLADDFPPIRTLDNPALRHNLPAHVSSFVGRVRELAQLAELVSSERLVTLVGAGGCGKTRLALQVSADLLDGSGDGVFFCDFSPLSDPQLVAVTVASALRLRTDPSRPIVDQLMEHLRERHYLLVFDNCEHVIDEVAKLADAVLRGCDGVHLLATSREPLAIDGEQVYRVPSLLLDGEGAGLASDAVQLFSERARGHNPEFVLDENTLPAVGSICRKLDGIPLAIELAAARLRALSLADVEARLSDRFRLLTGGSRTALPRHQTLRATVDWSYEALNRRDRAVFARLSVFSGSFSLEAAESVCTSDEVDGYEVLDAISSLVDKSLLQADVGERPARYQLLETIRQYGSEVLGADPGDARWARDAHAHFFLELAKRAAPGLRGADPQEWVGHLEADLDNLRSAGAYLLAKGTTEELLTFGVALSGFWGRSGRPQEGRALLEEALSRPDAEDHPTLVVWACSSVGDSYLYSVATTAERHLRRGLSLVKACHPAAAAELLRIAGWAAYHRGEAVRAVAFVEEALVAARKSGEEYEVAWALCARGTFRGGLDDPAGARSDFAEAVELWTRIGDRGSLAVTLSNLGWLELEQGNAEAARRHLEAGLAAGPSPSSRAYLLQNLAEAALLDGDVLEAAHRVVEATAVAHDLGDEHVLAGCALDAALCLTRAGEHERAALLHGAATARRERSGLVWESIEASLRSEDHRRLRADLGADAFENAHASGKEMTDEQLVRYVGEWLSP